MKIIKVLFVVSLLSVVGALCYSIYDIKMWAAEQQRLGNALIKAVNIQADRIGKVENATGVLPTKGTQLNVQSDTSRKKLPASEGSSPK